MKPFTPVLVLAPVCLISALAFAEEGWTQFRGPDRQNRSSDTGLLTSWPEEGPKLLWTARGLGDGFSTISIADGVIYTMGNHEGSEQILALNADSGEIQWRVDIGEAYQQGRGDGPRGTPTIDGGFLYGLGGSGNLACVDRQTHKVVWKKNILDEFGGENIKWGISESVLIDGDRLICTPGGSDATIVALDKRSGDVIWKTVLEGEDQAGYASPVITTVNGVRQYVQFTSRGTIGVRAEDGKFLWRNNRSANQVANCSSALISGNYVFTASGYGTGGALLKLNPTDEGIEAEFMYHTSDLKNHHGGMVLVDGYVYGSNYGVWTCLELATGDVKWKKRILEKGAVTYADGHLYLRGEKGTVVLAEANPEEYVEKGRFEQPERSDYNAWPHPVVTGGRLYLRDMDVLLCYDVRQ